MTFWVGFSLCRSKAARVCYGRSVGWLRQRASGSAYLRPELVDGEVVLKIDAVGICGSDMHAWHGHGPRRKPGLVLGHEFVGTVVESAAGGFEPGTRFTGNPLITCGVCGYCVQGRNNLCASPTVVGMTRPGAYAEYMNSGCFAHRHVAGHDGCGCGPDRAGGYCLARDQSVCFAVAHS